MTQNLNSKIEYQNREYMRMSAHWPLPKALRGGTPAMRAAGELYLPKEEKEKKEAYQARLKRSFLFSAYDDTVIKLVAKPFSEPVKIEGLPPELEDMVDNVDAVGRDVTQFSREAFDAAIGDYGLTHVLVEFPKQQTDAEGNPIPRSAADDKNNPIRPYWVHVRPDALVDWDFDKDENGLPRLAWIKVKIEVVERDENDKEKTITKYYYYWRDRWEIWTKNADGEYAIETQGTHTFNESNGGGIPLATFYANRDGALTGTPPLDRLAQINLAHWQSMSDQRNILRYSRFAILHLKGVTKEEAAAVLTVGGNKAIRSKSTDSDVKYVEHTGKAIAAGEADLKALEERMEVLGLQPVMSKIGNVKATGQAINEAKQQSSIQAWIRGMEDTLETLFEMSAIWLKKELPEDFSVDIYSSFSLGLKASEDIQSLIEMRKAVPPMISHETFIKEVKRRGILSDDVEPDQEVSDTAGEAPPLSTIGKGGKPDEEEIDDDETDEGEQGE